MSNLRAAYAEVMANYLANGAQAGSTTTATVTAKQTQSGWQNPDNGKLYVRVNGAEKSINASAKTKGNAWTVKIVPSTSNLISIS